MIGKISQVRVPFASSAPNTELINYSLNEWGQEHVISVLDDE